MNKIELAGQVDGMHQIGPPSPAESVHMIPKQYADAIERLGLSQRAAGRFLGVEERT
ncbi:MAG: hypothetical protein QG592_2161, partial [Pseudomonadota bacterium]|nr:hypothetical protein [Pseudomonadota bacterium]